MRRRVEAVLGWLLVGRLLVQDGDGWREVHHARGPYDGEVACSAARERAWTTALDDAYAVRNELRCVPESGESN